MHTILVVDDEKSIRDSIRMILEYEKYSVLSADRGAEGLNLLSSTPVSAVLLDIKMPDMDGIEVLEEMKKRSPDTPVIMISGHATIQTAVKAAKIGAFYFLPKPLDRDELLLTLRNALNQRELITEVKKTRDREVILGRSPSIVSILGTIERVAPTEARVLITGESGSGKELVAKAIFRGSKRALRPFVEVNCAAIPGELIESELFGHEKGSFTGATAQRVGKFELANGGTIFLDEIGDMSITAQAKVLRALEEGKIERVGGNSVINVDVRVLAATNKDLQAEIVKGTFREDLFHRLNVIPIHLPPLRERSEDIPILVQAFIEDMCTRNGVASKQISAEALGLLKEMGWRGNVRELRNAVERLVILCAGTTIEAADLTLLGQPRSGSTQGAFYGATSFQDYKDRSEAAFIRHQLEFHEWNISATAESLEMERSHLYTKIKKYSLERGS